MTDLKKIINGLESLHGRLLDAAKRDTIAMLDAIIVSDALALLKAQEPVYPTWEQYLVDLMTADMKADKTDNPNNVENYMRKTRIPSDIAQKLGIEPKEV